MATRIPPPPKARPPTAPPPNYPAPHRDQVSVWPHQRPVDGLLPVTMTSAYPEYGWVRPFSRCWAKADNDVKEYEAIVEQVYVDNSGTHKVKVRWYDSDANILKLTTSTSSIVELTNVRRRESTLELCKRAQNVFKPDALWPKHAPIPTANLAKAQQRPVCLISTQGYLPVLPWASSTLTHAAYHTQQACSQKEPSPSAASTEVSSSQNPEATEVNDATAREIAAMAPDGPSDEVTSGI